MRSLIVTAMVCCALAPQLHGGETLARFAPLRRVEADARKSYPLAEQNGPWMIYVASFAGPTAKQEAHQLVIELRQRFKVPAYTHRQSYDFSETIEGRGLDKYGQPKKMRYRNPSQFEEIAVLVGNFSSVNDTGMARLLNEIKYAKPQSLNLEGKQASSHRFAGFRAWQKKINPNKAKQTKGPMGQAFITRNPMLPDSFFAPSGFDSLVEQMNRGVKHSLLDCPAKYTVRVATFRGTSELDQRKVKEIVQSGRMESRLAEAAEKAHILVTNLRKRGVEAYEFHDRTESIVTIGSFQSTGSERSDGKTEINPAILKIMERYGAQQRALPNGQLGLAPVRWAASRLTSSRCRWKFPDARSPQTTRGPAIGNTRRDRPPPKAVALWGAYRPPNPPSVYRPTPQRLAPDGCRSPS